MPFNDGIMPVGPIGFGGGMSSFSMTSPMGGSMMAPAFGGADGFQSGPFSEGEESPEQQMQMELMEMIVMLMAELMQAQMQAQQGNPQAMQEAQQLEQALQSLLGGGQGGQQGCGGGGMPYAAPMGGSGAGGAGAAPAEDGGSGDGGGSAPSTSSSNSPSPNVSNVSAGGPINNPTDFANALLKGLGAPNTSANVQSIVNWENKEGGNWHNTASYNPLNTTESMPGDSSMNSVGVKAYTSWDQGLQATVKTLEGGQYNDIVSALKSGQGLGNGSYQGLSTWSGGGYSSV